VGLRCVRAAGRWIAEGLLCVSAHVKREVGERTDRRSRLLPIQAYSESRGGVKGARGNVRGSSEKAGERVGRAQRGNTTTDSRWGLGACRPYGTQEGAGL